MLFIEPTHCSHYCPRHGLVESTLVPAFREPTMCLWRHDMWMKNKVRVVQDRYSIKTKVKTQLKSLSFRSLPCLTQATWVLSPLNFIITFSDSDLFPRAKLLTRGWTNTNIRTGTEQNVWNAGCCINSSEIIFLCRVMSAFPKASVECY